jgi:hypothetical protein
MALTKDETRAWLLDYAWSGTAEEKARTVECILAQSAWEHVDAATERYAGMAETPGPAAVTEAEGFALSALYECHEGPHLPTCPDADSEASGNPLYPNGQCPVCGWGLDEGGTCRNAGCTVAEEPYSEASLDD